MARVVLDNVWKKYGDLAVVRSFNLEILDREFIVLVGPSGCGKSTTLRMIAGLEEVSEGTIRIGDRIVNDVHPKDRDIAMVFQNYALYPHWTVFDNMAFGLRLRSLPRDETRRRVREAARILEIEHLLERKPRALSGGQRQRVAMGRAIVRDPKVFLFDEPLSNLDAKLRVQMRVEISRLHNRLQTTIVYVTHDQVEAMTLADRIVIMNEGVIQQVGTPLEVYDHPANLFVATFIGSPAMNVFASTFDGTTLSGPGIRLHPTPAQLAALGSLRGDVTVGIRPQHLRIGTADSPGTVSWTVEVVEHLGSERFVYFRGGERGAERGGERGAERGGERGAERGAERGGEEGGERGVKKAGTEEQGLQATARLDGRETIEEGQPALFAADMEQIHLFDPSGRNLLHSGEAAAPPKERQ